MPSGSTSSEATRLVVSRLLIAVAIVPWVDVAHAQRLPLTNVSYETVFEAPLENPENDFQRALRIRVSMFNAALMLPSVIEEDSTLILTGLSYRLTDFDVSGWDSSARPARIDRVHELRHLVVLRQRLAERWNLVGQFRPGLFSDLVSVQRTHFRVEGGGSAELEIGKAHKAALGVVFSSNFGEPLVLPLAQYVLVRPRFRIQAIVPSKVEGFYIPTERVELGVVGELVGAQYRIGNRLSEFDKLKFNTFTVGPTLRYNPKAGLWATAAFGYTLSRRFEVHRGSTKLEEFALEKRPAIRLGLSYEVGP